MNSFCQLAATLNGLNTVALVDSASKPATTTAVSSQITSTSRITITRTASVGISSSFGARTNVTTTISSSVPVASDVDPPRFTTHLPGMVIHHRSIVTLL